MANTHSLQLNGTNQRVQISNLPEIGISAFTFEASIYINSQKTQGIYTTMSNNTDGFRVYITTTQIIVDLHNSGGNSSITHNLTVPTNEWHHIAVRRSASGGGTVKLFYDGVEVATTSNNATNIVSSATPNIGVTRVGTPDNFFDGKIDNVRMWNIERTSEQIKKNRFREITSETGLIMSILCNDNLLDSAGTTTQTPYNSPTFSTNIPFSNDLFFHTGKLTTLQDFHVIENESSNYNQTSLTFQYSGRITKAFIQLDIPSYLKKVDSGVIRLFTDNRTQSSTITILFKPLTSSFDETTGTWYAQPTEGSYSLSFSGNPQTGDIVSSEIARIVNDNIASGFGLSVSAPSYENAYSSFSSSEATEQQRPYVDYEGFVIPEAPSFSILSTYKDDDSVYIQYSVTARGYSILKNGIVISTNSHSDPGNVTESSSGYEKVTFSNFVKNLLPSSTYYYRFFAQTELGYVYSSEYSIITELEPNKKTTIKKLVPSSVTVGTTQECVLEVNQFDIGMVLRIDGNITTYSRVGNLLTFTIPASATQRDSIISLESGNDVVYSRFSHMNTVEEPYEEEKDTPTFSVRLIPYLK